MKRSSDSFYFLRVSAVGNRFVVIIFKKYVVPVASSLHPFQNLQVQSSQQRHKIVHLN